MLSRARRLSGLNSFITIDESAVLAAAVEADNARAAGIVAPLLGVPVGVKDSYQTRGLRTTLGVKTLAQFVPETDADVVAAIKAAGGLVFGKNNLVEMSFGLTGHNQHHGQVKNPHAPDHVSGGSSSGSAAAVAAGIVPAALGGDTVGSIRVPASLCGVVGFKPTTGRWPRDGVAPISHTLDTTGVFARTVEDCMVVDQVVTNEAGSQPHRSDLKGARLAYAPRQYLDLVDAETMAQFEDALLRLRDAGAEVEEVDLGDDFSEMAGRVTWDIFFRETKEGVSEFLRRNEFPASFEEIYRDLKPQLKDVWGHLVLPSGPGHLTEDAYRSAMSVDRPEIQRRLGDVFTLGGFDALVFPTTPSAAPSIDQQWKFTISGVEVDDLVLAKNTVPTSGAGIPGVSIPTGLNRSGLPIGIEFDGAHGHDRKLLDLARQAESVFEPLPALLSH
ncbi:amidase family protein [Aeromicrobium ginsengisoli]|nr:amidase family protein [Aeromicrobium ginsengisoli]